MLMYWLLVSRFWRGIEPFTPLRLLIVSRWLLLLRPVLAPVRLPPDPDLNLVVKSLYFSLRTLRKDGNVKARNATLSSVIDHISTCVMASRVTVLVVKI